MNTRICPFKGAVASLVVAMVGLYGIDGASDPIFGTGAETELDAHMRRHERQFYQFNALPFGLSLDANARDADAKALIEAFLAQDESNDVSGVTGSHPFELLSGYGEYHDLGQFGGVPLAGLCFEYRTLKREGALPDVLGPVRDRLVRAARSWHVFHRVTGGGIVARGIRRVVPEIDGDPPVPGGVPELIPLADEAGLPLPQPKDNGTWRADLSEGELPEGTWIWVDSCSKDQLLGQVFAMTVLYDTLVDDPDIDPEILGNLQEDAREIAGMLMAKRDVAGLEGATGIGSYDLIIMDADGRPTFWHDLNPLSFEKMYLPEASSTFNVFNLFMALGIVKGLYHVTGDPDIEEYLYVDLLAERDFQDMVLRARSEDGLDYIWVGSQTNFDNPDMTALALWLNLYLETDTEVDDAVRAFLEEGWWKREGESHSADRGKQPLWNAIYMTLTDRGVDPGLVQQTRDLLLAFELGPYWNEPRMNCDEDELAAGECLAVDGKTILTIAGTTINGAPVAMEALDPSIRPTSNYDARSNPYRVNGGGNGLRLNPGGDLVTSYWIGRYMQANGPGTANRSPVARVHVPIGGTIADPTPEAVTNTDVAAADPGTDETGPDTGAGSCRTNRGLTAGDAWSVFVLLIFLFLVTRSRCASSR